MSDTVSSDAVCTVVALKRPGSRIDGATRSRSLQRRYSAEMPPYDVRQDACNCKEWEWVMMSSLVSRSRWLSIAAALGTAAFSATRATSARLVADFVLAPWTLVFPLIPEPKRLRVVSDNPACNSDGGSRE